LNWVPLIVVGVILVSIATGVIIIRQKIRKFSKTVFGTESIAEGLRNQQTENSNIPKSVASMTKIYLPQIQKDFPEFNYQEFKAKVENMLKSAFVAITNENPDLLVEASDDLKDSVRLIIESNKEQGKKEVYDNITIYQTEITKYSKVSGTCVITLQSAVGHLHYIKQNGKVIAGSTEFREQCRYNTDIIYIQDVNKLTSDKMSSIGTNCPNCGAPIKNLGGKFCEYCGTGVRVININVWTINKYQKL
jgi:hypothetical protein